MMIFVYRGGRALDAMRGFELFYTNPKNILKFKVTQNIEVTSSIEIDHQ